MKKILMTMVAAFAALSMNAQDYYVGGALGFQTKSYDGDNLGNTIMFMPEVGMKVDDQWSIGVVVGYANTKTSKNATGTIDLNTSAFKIAPYARYTAFKFGAVNVFADGVFSLVSGNQESYNAITNSADDNKYTKWGIAIQPGIAYNISDNFSLVAKFGNLIGYESSKPDGGKATTTLDILNLSGNNLSFGFYYNF